MKKIIPILILALLLPSCAPAGRPEARLTVVCTTYPIYLFAAFVTEGVEGVAVERLDTGSTSCLHDYTLSMADMKKLERADVIAVNGAGLEEFLEDALAASDAVVIDCSEGVELLENLSHDHNEDDHDHDGHDHGHWDPHYWMDPENARIMVSNLRNYLVLTDPDYAAAYEKNAYRSDIALRVYQEEIMGDVWEKYSPQLGEPPVLITFHDGFQYFAKALGIELLASIEEEAGSEASAREIVEITELVKEYNIPVIFTEVNGSDATARAIARETGCRVAQLSMLMDGPEPKASDLELGRLCNYFNYGNNVVTVVDSFAGRRVVPQG
ncbi:MAG: zinc ABC transporter substrate-binding protein [Lawsonibacter sp.]|nr:zinc ABC transporter substrate-binding protein [Lawsonibacter sp.]